MTSSTKRFLALLSGPLFLLLNGKFGNGVDHETQRLLLEVILGYFVTSKGGEAIIENARAKASGPIDVQAVLARAAAEGGKLTQTTTSVTP